METTMSTIAKNLQRLLFSYRSTPHSSMGMTQDELFYGRRLMATLDKSRPAGGTKMDRPEFFTLSADAVRSFDQGDLVWTHSYSDTKIKWVKGTVERRLSPVLYLVKDGRNDIKLNVGQLFTALAWPFSGELDLLDWVMPPEQEDSQAEPGAIQVPGVPGVSVQEIPDVPDSKNQ